jgi:hypothetical protein
MTFVDYIIKERSRKFLSISLMDMEKSNYKGTLEEWFSDMYTEYKIINPTKNDVEEVESDINFIKWVD